MAVYPAPTQQVFQSRPFQAFLAEHPFLAGLNRRREVNEFLDNHPKIAARYLALVNGQPDPTPTTAGTVPTTTAAAPVAAGPTVEQLSAKAVLAGILDRWGLADLGAWAWDQFVSGVPEKQIMLDVRSRPEYKARFAGMDELAAKGRAISEDQWVALERSFAQQMRAYGLPASFYDSPADFSRLIVGEVSPEEFGQRLAIREQVALADPRGQRLRDALTSLYGITEAQGLTTAYWTDPDRATDLIKKQFAAAQAASAAVQAGFGTLDRAQAERVASFGLSEQQQVQGFADLASLGELTQALPGGSGGSVSRDELIDAGLGSDAAARRKVARVADTRKARLGGGTGGFATDKEGISGLS